MRWWFQKEVNIKFDQVESWIKEYAVENGMYQKVKRYNVQLEELKEQLRKKLEALENAGLLNENIPERAKQVMDGNRKTYVQRVNVFIDELPKIKDFSDSEYAKRISKIIDGLTKDTQKAYYVLKEFLESDLAQVARKVKAIEDSAISLQQDLEKKNVEKLVEILDLLKSYDESIEKRKFLEKEIEKIKEEKKQIEIRKTQISTKIRTLKSEKGYKEYQELEEKFKKDNTKKHKKNIEIGISKIRRNIRSYKKEILEDPLTSLADKKKREEIESAGGQTVVKEYDKYKEQLEERKILERRVQQNTTMLNMKEQETWLKGVEDKITEEEKAIERIENQLESINPRLIRNKIRDKLKDFKVVMDG